MKLKCRHSVFAGMALLTTGAAHANLTFNLIPDPGTPQYAVDSFTAAAAIWSAVLADDVTINIRIGYTALGAGIVGSTDSEFVERSYTQVLGALAERCTSADDYSAYAAFQLGANYSRLINHTSNNPNGPNSATPYVDTMDRVGLTTANAKLLGLLPSSTALDATIRFSSNYSFDFSHGSAIAPGELDFVGATAHEIGHALGFVSGVDDIDTLGGMYPGSDFSSNLIDLFRYSTLSLDTGPGCTDYTADSRDKYFSVDGGVHEVAQFATGLTYGDGRQASHWEDHLGIGLMDPTIDYGEFLELSATDLRLFDVLGYTLVPEPGAASLLGMGLTILVVRRWRSHAA